MPHSLLQRGMKNKHRYRSSFQKICLLLIALGLFCNTGFVPAALLAAEQAPNGHVVYLVRHAERADDSPDSALSEKGRLRADTLARLLGEASISQIYSTDTRRTRATAQPLAEALQLPITEYPASELASLAATLMTLDHNALVVGHSNTTPQLARLLGIRAVQEISELEYDRLYIVVLAAGKPVADSVLRYGQ